MCLANLTYINLLYFSIVFDERNLSKAADRICISRQALSKSISSIEKNLGKALFQRTKNGVEPTEAAQELIPHVRTILREYDYLSQHSQLEELRMRRVTVYTIDAISQVFPNSFYEEFHEKHPNIVLTIEEKNEEYATQQLLSGKCDFAIVSQYSNYYDYNANHLFHADFGSYMSEDHPLSKYDVLKLRDFDGLRFVGKTMDLDYYSQAVADIYKNKLGLDFFLEITNPGKRRDLVREGNFVSCAWNYNVFNDMDDGVVFRPVPEMGDGIDLYLIGNKNEKVQSQNAAIFKRFLLDWIAQQTSISMAS